MKGMAAGTQKSVSVFKVKFTSMLLLYQTLRLSWLWLGPLGALLARGSIQHITTLVCAMVDIDIWWNSTAEGVLSK